MTPRDEDAWFAPKRYGYGSSLPITWQGWAVSIGYALLVTGAAFLIPYSWAAFTAIMLAASAALIVVCAQRTRGGWRWRWGERD